MLAEQSISCPRDGGTRPRLAPRLDGNIAFGIQAHRAIGEVGRSDSQPLVIHDHQFRVEVALRVVSTESIITVSLVELTQQDRP